MTGEDSTQTLLNTLEDQLVKEFRVCTRLRDLTRDERAALVNNNVQALSTLVEHKEAALDELGRLDDARRSVSDQLATLLKVHEQASAQMRPSIARLLSAIEPAVAEKLGRLREGILAVMDQVSELTQGNSLLAASAIERNAALQTFLLNQFQPVESYAPPGMRLGAELPKAMGCDHLT